MGLFPVICRIEKPTMAKNKNVGKPRNYALESGVYRFGKSKTYHKKAVYKFVKKTTPKKAADTKPTFVEKPVKGDKNGGKRMVRVKRLRSDVPTYVRPGRGTSKQFFSKHARSLRASLQPGTVAGSCWSPQRQEGPRSQTIGFRTCFDHWSHEIEWLPYATNQPTILVGHNNQRGHN